MHLYKIHSTIVLLIMHLPYGTSFLMTFDLLPLLHPLFIYLGFYLAFNTVQVISQRVVGRAEETSTYSSSVFCTVNCWPTASNYQLYHLRSCREPNPSLRVGRRECYHSATMAPLHPLDQSQNQTLSTLVSSCPGIAVVAYNFHVPCYPTPTTGGIPCGSRHWANPPELQLLPDVCMRPCDKVSNSLKSKGEILKCLKFPPLISKNWTLFKMFKISSFEFRTFSMHRRIFHVVTEGVVHCSYKVVTQSRFCVKHMCDGNIKGVEINRGFLLVTHIYSTLFLLMHHSLWINYTSEDIRHPGRQFCYWVKLLTVGYTTFSVTEAYDLWTLTSGYVAANRD